ncbi:MAG TPA: lasso peptide isopeptide bond-forming cyclase [Gemmatimonadaceae bacterium]|nr:lasso peptide isopeptide bond-forming cyclase [Gemmatimonadaceae bacterium]
MSAICGILRLDGKIGTHDDVAAMSAALAHRGPDRNGVWSGNGVAIAHRLLITTPESASEVQPLASSQSDLVLVADARIDNRDELISALQLAGGRRSTDSEIILAAYERWRDECVDRLIGDFAFAIWDPRANSFFCARDPMGVKPFYYFRNDRLFAFATELKSLLSLAEVTATIDPDEVAFFVGWSHEERTRTMYRDLLRLPAAHTLVVSPARTTLRQYWTAEAARDVRFKTDDEYVEAFRETFRTAVDARLRCAQPVGATLSGGLDSSSIVCMSRRLREQANLPLHTFSVIFPSLPERELNLIDERSFVDAVVQSGGVEPHYVRGDELSPLRDVNRILWHLDEPYSAPNLYLHWGMFEAANQNGVRVLLDGFDGDSAVSHGFGRLTGLARANKWDALEAEVRAFSTHHGKSPELALSQYVLPHLAELARRGSYVSWFRAASDLGKRFGLSHTKLATSYGIRPMLPNSFRELSTAMRDNSTLESSLLQPSLADALLRQTRLAQAADHRRAVQSEREAHVQGLSQPLYQLTLEIADKSAAAFGIEPRYPFFDRRLIEFCLGLPEEQKFAGGWPRLLLRRAMNGILPPAIQWRSTKANLSPNFHRRFRAVDVGTSEMLDYSALAPFMNTDRVRDLFMRYRHSPERTGMNRQALTLFRTAVLGTWLNQLSDRSHRVRSEAGALSPVAA